MTSRTAPADDQLSVVDLITEARYTPREAAKLIKLSPSSIYALMNSGELGHYNTRPRRIGQHHITAFLTERNREGKPRARRAL